MYKQPSTVRAAAKYLVFTCTLVLYTLKVLRVLAVILLVGVVPSALGAKILALFTVPCRSHLLMTQPLLRELAARGHQVTVVSSYPLEEPTANYTDIVLTNIASPISYFSSIEELRYPSNYKKFTTGWRILTEHCENFLTDSNVQELINSDDRHFDLIIYDTSIYYECTLGFAHKFRAPTVAICHYRGDHFIWDIVGTSAPYSYVPSVGFAISDRMDFWDRFGNTVISTGLLLLRYFAYLPWCDQTMKRYFNDSTMPTVRELERNTSVLLVGSHVSLDYPRPAVPAMINVGGLNVGPAKPLPKGLQKFLDGAEHGAILFSFGSIIKSSMIPDAFRQSFVDAFSVLNQRILWSWNGDPIPNLPANVRTEKWLPQRDILAHPSLRLYICHGGYNGMLEGIYHGVPVLGIPMYGDQFWAMKLFQDKGLAVSLDFASVTNQTLSWALYDLLNDSSYRENARLASLKMRDNLQTPLETAVYWTEYVIRHKGARHLRVGALDLHWYQYMLLDILAAMLAPFIILVATCVVLRWKFTTKRYSM